jgi:hypothetical protein
VIIGTTALRDSGIAPKARQRVYFAPNTDAGFLDAVAASLHATPPPDSVSISWGKAESSWTQQARNAMDAVFAQLVAKGIPVFAPLLSWLYQHAVRPEFTCRFRWRANSIAFWDNRCVQHNAINDYQGQRRVMHRVTIEGERPI